MYKRILALGVMILCLVILAANVLAAPIPVIIEEVKVDNDVLKTGTTNALELQRGQEISVKVKIKATADADNLQVEAAMRGSDFKELVEDISDTFRLKKDVSRVISLKLRLPSRLEQDRFLLRIRAEDRNGDAVQQNFDIEISAKRHDITIKDFVLNPENEVKAGRNLLVSLRLKNTGQKDEKGVKVRVSIPELGVSATDYINEINRENDDDDQATSGILYLRIPNDADTGIYTLKAEVFFRDGDEAVTKQTQVNVIGEEKIAEREEAKKEEKTIIFVGTDRHALTVGGAELFYPITITNLGTESKAYVLSVDNAEWATFRVAPSNVAVVNNGDSKTLNVYAAAKAGAPEGEQLFLATVKSGDKVLKQIPLKAVISKQASLPATGFKIKTVLEVLALVLLVLLIIIVLVFGLSKIMRKDDEEGNKDKGEETYY